MTNHNETEQEIAADEVLLALQCELPQNVQVTFLYRADGQIMRALSEQPKFACRHDVVKFLEAYQKARAEFFQGVYALVGKRFQVIDEELPAQPIRVH